MRLNGDPIVRVGFIACPTGRRGAGLDCNDCAPRQRIMRADVSRVALMKMSGEQQIHLTVGEDRNRVGSATDEFNAGAMRWRNERMMCNQKFARASSAVN